MAPAPPTLLMNPTLVATKEPGLPLQVFGLSHELSGDAHLRLGTTAFGRLLSQNMHDPLGAHAECTHCNTPAVVLADHMSCPKRYGMVMRIPREHVPAVKAEFELELRRDICYQQGLRRRANLSRAGGKHSQAQLRELYRFQQARCFNCLRSLGTLCREEVVLAKDHFLPV